MEDIDRKKYSKKCGVCQKNVTWIHGSKPEICPLCSAIKWDKPKDEAVLFNLQEKYLENRDEKILGQMYAVMIPYTHKIINKLIGGNIHFDEDRLEDKIEDTITQFISYYLRKPNYKITESFGFQLLKSAQQQLYRKKQQDIDRLEMSYDAPLKGGEDKTFKDKISEDFEDGNKYSREIVDLSNKMFLVKELSLFVDKIYNSIAKNRGIDEAILSLVLLHHYLNKKKECFFDEFYNYYGSDLRESFELEKIVLLQYLEELNSANYR
jgi:hypothetical protein